MKKIFLFLALVACLQVYAQDTNTWKNYSFGNYCSLSIPNSLELRDPSSESGRYLDKNVHQLTLKFGGDAAYKSIVFQPQGMNSSDPKVVHTAMSAYARVIVELIPSGGITQSDIDNASAAEITELNSMFYQSYYSDAQTINRQAVSQFKWTPLKRAKYSGKNALVLHFKRPGLEGTVDVTEYRFFMRGQQLRIVFSCRDSERSRWAADFAKIISTLKFK